MTEFVSILMLTHNAPDYVEISVRTVKDRTAEVDYELVVVDNASEPPTRNLVQRLASEKLIDTLFLSDTNTLFAEGNNIASRKADTKASHFLLLNSDIEVKDEFWLRHLLDTHQGGITAYGVAHDPDRVDGYCLLIDAPLYREFGLDEGHQWWWAVTKLQALVMNEGLPVRGYQEHAKYLHHFGGKSGSAFANAKGMNVSRKEVLNWFAGKRPQIIDEEQSTVLTQPGSFARRAYDRIVRMITR